MNVYKLFSECFPNFNISSNKFYKRLAYDDSNILKIEDGGKLLGFSIVNNNSILLLCIAPEMQKKGLGTVLLGESENMIKSKGYEKVILGLGNTYLFQGVPFLGEEKPYNFFIKHGYSASWISNDLKMKLADFSYDDINIPEPSVNVEYRFIKEHEKNDLLLAVSQVDKSWVKYFVNCDSVLIAVNNNEIVGFAIVSIDDSLPYFAENSKVGSIGCVGVIPKARKKGIGLSMVAYATNEIKNMGCDEGFIGCTHLESWYNKLGYRTCMRFWMGEKNI